MAGDQEAMELKRKYEKIPDEQNAILLAIEEVMNKLNQTTSYDNRVTLECQHIIYNLHDHCINNRREICDRLIELKYPEFVMRALQWLKDKGIFVSQSRWNLYMSILHNVITYSEGSTDFCKKCGDVGLIKFCLTKLSKNDYTYSHKKEAREELDESFLVILANLSKASENICVFHGLEDSGKTILWQYSQCDNELLKVPAIMTLTNIMNEHEHKRLQDTGAIKFMLEFTRKAIVSNDERRYNGYAPLEIVECLRQMSLNDENKPKFLEQGALPLFAKMLRYDDEDENIAVCETLWTLAFDDNIKKKLVTEEGLIDCLEGLQKSKTQKLKEAADGVVWKLINEKKRELINENKRELIDADKRELMIEDECEPTKKDPDVSTSKLPKVFLSYNWDHQDTIKEINESLKSEESCGQVWFDVHNMEGSLLDSMAAGIEEADIFIMAVSEKYKNSLNCQSEAKYAYKLKKPIIPLMVQKKYVPDGWLGILLGDKLFFPFHEECKFQESFTKLQNEIDKKWEKIKQGLIDVQIEIKT